MYNQLYLDEHDARRLAINPRANKPKLRVAMAVRVSTQHEMQMNALDNQEQWAIELAHQHESDWIFNPDEDMYVEEGISGTSLKGRRAFKDMIIKAKAGCYDLIVVREVCRFMRNMRLTLDLIDDLKQIGVEIYFVNDNIRTFNENDYFKLAIMAQYAEQESRKISERVFSGQATARSNGVLFGNGNILGYRHVKGEKSCDSTYITDEEQAETVRLIFKMCIEGNGIKKIRNYLVDNRYKNSKGEVKWFDSTIQRILRNVTYKGYMEYFQSYTSDPLSHTRIKIDKDRHIIMKGKFPAIIDEYTWDLAQKALDSRTQKEFVEANNKRAKTKGIKVNKDIYCQKMRCGCGRRFRKDFQTKTGASTYVCYQVVEDGSQDKRIERSKILNDDCSVYGIRDWKMSFITREVFNHLNYNIDSVKDILFSTIDKYYTSETQSGYSEEDLLKIDVSIERIIKKNENLLDMLEEGIIDKALYIQRKNKNDLDLAEQYAKKESINAIHSDIEEKNKTLDAVKEFLEKDIDIPLIQGNEIPEALIDAYINSIKVRANNVYEYDIKVSPYAKNESPLVVPEEEYNPLLHSATKMLDNSGSVTIAEFTLDYEDAKIYANGIKRKVKRVHWEKPAVIRICTRL